MPKKGTLWSDEDNAALAEMYPRESMEAIMDRFPNHSWASLRKTASLRGIQRLTRRPGKGAFLSGRVHEWLTEQREWDAGGFSPHEGWRDMGAIASAAQPNGDKAPSACRALLSQGRVESTEGESGWVFWRATE